MANDANTIAITNDGWNVPTGTTPAAVPATTSDGWNQPTGFTGVEETLGEKTQKELGLTPVNLATGAAKSVLQAPTAVGELIQKIPGIGEKIIPEAGLKAEEAASTPQGLGEKTGALLEQAGEFALQPELEIPEITRMLRIAKASPDAILFLEKHPTAAKIILNTLKSGAAGAASGAVHGKPGEKLTEAGAGAVGGLVGGLAGEATSEAMEALSPTSFEDAIRASKPGKWNKQFIQDWETSAPEFVKDIKAEGKFDSMMDAAKRMRDTTNDYWEHTVLPATKKLEKDVVNTDPVYDAIKNTPISRFRPEAAKEIDKLADQFNPSKLLTFSDLEKDLKDLNREISATGVWEKPPRQRAAILDGDPTIAPMMRAADAIREQLFTYADKQGISNLAEMRNTYGAMSNVTNAVEGQANVAARQAPISLKQTIGIVSGLAQGSPIPILATLLDKLYNNPTALLNRAYGKEGASVGTKVAQAAVKGARAAIERETPAAGSEAARWIRMQMPDKKDQHVMIHPEDVDEAEKRGLIRINPDKYE